MPTRQRCMWPLLSRIISKYDTTMILTETTIGLASILLFVVFVFGSLSGSGAVVVFLALKSVNMHIFAHADRKKVQAFEAFEGLSLCSADYSYAMQRSLCEFAISSLAGRAYVKESTQDIVQGGDIAAHSSGFGIVVA